METSRCQVLCLALYSVMQSDRNSFKKLDFSLSYYNFWTKCPILILKTPTSPYSCSQKLLFINKLSKLVVHKLYANEKC